MCWYFASYLLFCYVSGSISECQVKNELALPRQSYSIEFSVYNGTIGECGCGKDATVCVRKCCEVNYYWENKTCVFNDSVEFKIDVYDKTEPINDSFALRLIPGLLECPNGGKYYRLDPASYPEDLFFLQTDGSLYQPEVETSIDIHKHCIEYFDDIGLSALACVNYTGQVGKGLNAIGMIISIPFLLVTFIVYALLPNRNLHGKSLMCYVLSLCITYVLLVIIQTQTQIVGAGCKVLGYFCFFFFMVSFFWLNVMSIDIWWTFKGLRGLSGNKTEMERKRFLMYSAYSWGVPILFVVVISSLNAGVDPNSWYHPGIGNRQCWFNPGLSSLIYFYGPVAVILVSNVVLFARTAWKIKQVQADTAVLRNEDSSSNQDKDKQRFNLYLKLMLGMGVNWSMDVISWAFEWHGLVHPAVWYLTDFCNALYGVFIFFIFVFKKNIWKMLKKRYSIIRGRVSMERSPTTYSSSAVTTTVTYFCKK